LIIFSLLACLSALTGIYLNIAYWFGGRKHGAKQETIHLDSVN
jgi:hypothetical protein